MYRQSPLFKDRTDAGQRLAEELVSHSPPIAGDVVVLAIVRGGVPVAIEVAQRLDAPLDLVIPRKIPIPSEPEAGYGAITEDGVIVLNEPLVRQLGLTPSQIDRQVSEVRQEIARRSALYRARLSPVPLEGKTAIIIDDGLASGYTMIAAARSVRQRRASGVVVAVPAASHRAYDLVKPTVDKLVALAIGTGLYFAVASYYYRWHDLTDEEVIAYLDHWQESHPKARPADSRKRPDQ